MITNINTGLTANMKFAQLKRNNMRAHMPKHEGTLKTRPAAEVKAVEPEVKVTMVEPEVKAAENEQEVKVSEEISSAVVETPVENVGVEAKVDTAAVEAEAAPKRGRRKKAVAE